MIEDLLAAMKKAVDLWEERGLKDVILVHHNDSDGLSSGAILLESFEKIGCRVTRYSLEKPYPQVLETILGGQGKTIVFADFAGKISRLISELNGGRNLVLILDHHPAESVDDQTVLNLDGELFGLKGDRDISASSTCYLFARLMLTRYGYDGEIYAHLAVLGAVGDGFLVNGVLSGVNRDILETAVQLGLVRIERSLQKEEYFLRLGGIEYPALEICTVLDTLGGVGYYSDGASRGIEVCLSGMTSEIRSFADELIRRKNEIFEEEIRNLNNNLHTTDHIQWFNVENRFQPMGVKMIGVFCTEIKEMEFLDRTKYLAGFQNVPDSVPGFGSIAFHSTKISMRVSGYMTQRIREGEIPGLNSFLPAATDVLGGFSDACHTLSAATTVKIGQDQQLITEMENILKKRMNNT